MKVDLEVAIGLGDHQVRLEREPGHPPERADDHRPDRDVRDEMSVHDVHVDAVGARCLDFGDLLAQAREIG